MGEQPFIFKHSTEYARLNVEAQRGFPNQVKPPYLTWHFSVWPEYEAHYEQQTSPAGREKARADWHARQNEFIKFIVGENAAHIEPFNVDTDEVGQNTLKGNVFTFEGIDVNPAILMRTEFHEEHVSYTFILPIVDPLTGDGAPINEKPVRMSLSGQPHQATDPRVNALARDVFENITRFDGEDDDAYRDRAALAWDRLYDAAWQLAFEPRVPNDIQQGYYGAQAAETKAKESFWAKPASSPVRSPPGLVFCNFRGVVLARDWLVGGISVGEQQRHLARVSRGLEQFIPTDLTGLPEVASEAALSQQMGYKSRDEFGEAPPTTPRRWNRVSAGRVLARNTALRHAIHWQGGKVPDQVGQDPHFHRRTVSSLLLEGRAIYASSFAAWLDDAVEDPAWDGMMSPSQTAVRYSVFYCREDDDRAQAMLGRRLDRTVLRLHSLGTLRLLALKDLRALYRVDNELSIIEGDITNAGQNPYSRLDDEGKTVFGLYKRLAKMANLTTGNVYFRVSKSALYSTQFKRLVKDLCPDLDRERIEGWEPYAEFVNRRLYSQFENIARIGERLANARDRLDRIIEIANLKRS
ncbi:MAG: DUF3422 family protein, partial [Pseudomonadota bacterium]